MPRTWSKTEAFAHFGIELENVRWSWSGVSADGGKVALVLWQDGIRSRDGGPRYHDDEDLGAEWRQRIGAVRRHEHLRHAVTHLGGRFHAVIAKAVDVTASPRQIGKCFPQQGVEWQVESFDEETGAFRAFIVRPD